MIRGPLPAVRRWRQALSMKHDKSSYQRGSSISQPAGRAWKNDRETISGADSSLEREQPGAQTGRGLLPGSHGPSAKCEERTGLLCGSRFIGETHSVIDDVQIHRTMASNPRTGNTATGRGQGKAPELEDWSDNLNQKNNQGNVPKLGKAAEKRSGCQLPSTPGRVSWLIKTQTRIT